MNDDYTVHSLGCQCRKCLLVQLEPGPRQDAAEKDIAAFLQRFCAGHAVPREEILRRIQERGASVQTARPALAKYLHKLIEFHIRQAAQDGVDDSEMLVRMILNAFVVGMVAENVRMEVRGESSSSVPRVPR